MIFTRYYTCVFIKWSVKRTFLKTFKFYFQISISFCYLSCINILNTFSFEFFLFRIFNIYLSIFISKIRIFSPSICVTKSIFTSMSTLSLNCKNVRNSSSNLTLGNFIPENAHVSIKYFYVWETKTLNHKNYHLQKKRTFCCTVLGVNKSNFGILLKSNLKFFSGEAVMNNSLIFLFHKCYKNVIVNISPS